MSLWKRWVDQTLLGFEDGTARSDVGSGGNHGTPSIRPLPDNDALTRRCVLSVGGRACAASRSTPTVTLFYDGVKRLTVAVLARATASSGLQRYLDGRADQGSAYQVSPLYYELEGYVRENLFEIRKQLSSQNDDATGCCDESSVSVAIGSLEESDQAQRQELQEKAEEASRTRSQGCDAVDAHTLEAALEIARLHRLNEDLDVLSIYFLRQVSKVFGRVAVKIAHSRLRSIQLVAIPYIDGMMVSGYSKAVRRDGTPMKLVRHSEGGRLVEYEECAAIRLLPIGTPVACGQYAPSSPTTEGSFSWQCEEIALAQLHRWWGDIAPPDYVGQKLVLSWEAGGADDVVTLSHPSLDDDLSSNPPPDDRNVHSLVPVAVLRVPPTSTGSGPAAAADGARVLLRHGRCVRAQLRTVPTDPARWSPSSSSGSMSTIYSGTAVLERVDLAFSDLVRGAARRALPLQRHQCQEIEETRPLLVGEASYLCQLESLATASP